MPWTPLILVTVLFSMICGNRLLDNHLRRPYVASRNAGALLANTANGRKCIKSLTDGGTVLQQDVAVRRFYGLETDYGLDDSKIVSSLYDRNDCFGADTLAAAAIENVDYPDDMRAPSDIKRDEFARESRNFDRNGDLLSNIFTLDGLSQDAKPVGSTNVHNEPETIIPISQISPHIKPPPLLPPSYSTEFYEDLLSDAKKEDAKRAGTAPVIGCDCKIKNDLLDLGQQHFPRYLLNAVCQTENEYSSEYQQKCWRGSYCKPLEYKVKVLTFRMDQGQKDPTLAWLPDDLRQLWKFKTVTVAAGCFCSY